MEWIKKNTDQFVLALLALGLLAVAVLFVLKVQAFPDSFSGVQSTPPRNDKIPPVDLAVLTGARDAASKPAQWTPKAPAGGKKPGSLFVSDRYVVKGGKLEAMDTAEMFYPPLPNGWLRKYGLSLLNASVLTEDPDKDGFSNRDEFLGASRAAESTKAEGDPDSTIPTDAKSHPPYHTQLYLKQFIPVRFRLQFKAYNGDIKEPAKMDFQINALDHRQPSQFLKIGETIAGTTYKVDKFEFKTQVNPATGAESDISQLTMVNTETGSQVVLVLDRITASPDSEGLFIYRWTQPAGQAPQEFKIRKNQEFVLRPETTVKYKLIDINDTEAVIQLPSGEKYTVPKAQ